MFGSFFAGIEASIDVGLSSSDFFKDNISRFVNNLESGHGLDGVFPSNSPVFVDINFNQIDSSLFALRNNIGCNSFARSTPGSMEINQAFISFLKHGIELLRGISVVWHILFKNFIKYLDQDSI